MEQIEVRVSSRNFGCRVRQRRRRETRGVNYNNLTRIRCTSNYIEKKQKQSKAILPKICCLNARSINGKVDELAAFMSANKVHIAAITESWLTDEIGDDQISIGGYVIHRKDRTHGRGGGVCVYVSQQISITRYLELENLNLECMWLWARPPRLPRPLSAIAVCVVYNPPDKSVQEQRELCDYLVSSIDTIRSKYPDCGIVVLGDFNHLNIQDLVTSHNLKQVVTRPTRQDSILDYIITNLKSFYKTPDISAPLGTSDHNVIMWIPKDIFKDNNNTCTKRTVRRYPQSGLNGFGLWSTRNKWFSGLGLNPSSDELASSFTNDLNTAFDHFFPVNTIKFHPTDKPWITGHIKQLIKERQRAFHTGDAQLWRQYTLAAI